METKFQTSFIPKKPVSQVSLTPQIKHHHTVSVFMGISIFLFILSIAGVGTAYMWTQYLETKQEEYIAELTEREKQFKIELIDQLKQIDTKIDLAGQILERHVSTSRVFEDIISRITVEKVSFNSLELKKPENGIIPIVLEGYGANLSAVAFQSDVLSNMEQYNMKKVVINPIIEKPVLEENGTVSFTLSAELSGNAILYKTYVKEDAQANGLNTETVD